MTIFIVVFPFPFVNDGIMATYSTAQFKLDTHVQQNMCDLLNGTIS